MSVFIIALHVIVCVALIMIVLLQTGKGANMGAAFGGGLSSSLFGNTGATTFLSKATTIAAIIFMITSLSLAYISGNKKVNSIITDAKIKTTVKTPAKQNESHELQSKAEGNAFTYDISNIEPLKLQPQNELFRIMNTDKDIFDKETRCLKKALLNYKSQIDKSDKNSDLPIKLPNGCIINSYSDFVIMIQDWMKQKYLPDLLISNMWLQIYSNVDKLDGDIGEKSFDAFNKKFGLSR